MMHYRVSAVRSALCAFPFLLLIGTADIAHAKPGGKGGNKPPPVENTPLALSEEYYYFRVAGEDSCVGEDDQLRWSAEGSLAPGESFTFTPQKPACSGHPAAISVWASWDTGSLELRSIVPDADLASLDAEQVGQLIIAPEVGKTAQLCMFPAYNSDGVNYTITVHNRSSEPVHGIVLQGKSRNDWAIHYYPNCLNADADADGWNDSLEHSMTNLLYPNNYIEGVFQADILWGSNYLRSQASSASPQDEIDSYPPDFNDDGVVDEHDAQVIQGWLGQGNGIPLQQISPNPGANGYHSNTLPWRRYDLDGDGYVAEEDFEILNTLLGKPVPMLEDLVSPTARLLFPAEGDSVPRGTDVMLEAHAWDNMALARVDYLVDGRVVCSRTNPIPDFGTMSPFYYCWWSVPKRSRDYTLEVRATDVSGRVSTSRPVHVSAR